MCADLAEAQAQIRAQHVPKLLFSMACLEYRFWQIAPLLLDIVERNINQYGFHSLVTIMHSMATLNICGSAEECRFGAESRLSKNYQGLFAKCLKHVMGNFLPKIDAASGEFINNLDEEINDQETLK